MHGFCHFEIPAKDFARARGFYGEVFGWKFEEMQAMDYMLFVPPAGIGGGFSKSAEPSVKPGFLPYIEVDDIEATLRKIESCGGKKITGKTAIGPEYGFIALFQDPDNNHIGLWAKN